MDTQWVYFTEDTLGYLDRGTMSLFHEFQIRRFFQFDLNAYGKMPSNIH